MTSLQEPSEEAEQDLTIPPWVNQHNKHQERVVDQEIRPKQPNYFLRRLGVGALLSGIVLGGPAAYDIAGPKSDITTPFTEELTQGNGSDTVWQQALRDLHARGIELQSVDSTTVDDLRSEISHLVYDKNGIAQPGATVTIHAEESPLLHRLSLSATEDNEQLETK